MGEPQNRKWLNITRKLQTQSGQQSNLGTENLQEGQNDSYLDHREVEFGKIDITNTCKNERTSEEFCK